MDLQLERDMESYKRMYTEFLVITYNDILTCEQYVAAVEKWLLLNDKASRVKLRNHMSSINWLLNKSIGSICFDILKLNHLTHSNLNDIINKKFKSFRGNYKFFKSFAKEIEDKLDSQLDT